MCSAYAHVTNACVLAHVYMIDRRDKKGLSLDTRLGPLDTSDDETASSSSAQSPFKKYVLSCACVCVYIVFGVIVACFKILTDSLVIHPSSCTLLMHRYTYGSATMSTHSSEGL